MEQPPQIHKEKDMRGFLDFLEFACMTIVIIVLVLLLGGGISYWISYLFGG